MKEGGSRNAEGGSRKKMAVICGLRPPLTGESRCFWWAQPTLRKEIFKNLFESNPYENKSLISYTIPYSDQPSGFG